MAERQVTLGMQLVADVTPARATVEQFIKEITGRGISIPIGMGGGPSSTLGGGSVGQTPSMPFGSASPNWSMMFTRMTSELTAGISAAISKATQAATAGVGAVGAVPAGPSGGGGGSMGAGVFNRVIGRLVGGYAVGAAASAFTHYGINTQLEGVASAYGTPRDVMNAQRNTYQGLVSGLPLLGPMLDFALGGTASFAAQDYQQAHADASLQSGVRRLSMQRRGQMGVIDQINAQTTAMTRGQFSKRFLAADLEYDKMKMAFADQELGLSDRIQAEDDSYKANDLRRELNSMMRAHGKVLSQAELTKEVTKREARRDLSYFEQSMGAKTRAQALFGEGRARAGELADFDADTRMLLNDQDPLTRDTFSAFRAGTRSRIIQERAREDLATGSSISGHIRATQSLVSHDPKRAIYQRAEAALGALEAADPDDPNTAARINLIGAQRNLELQQFDEGTEGVRLNQRTHRRQLEALMNRNPMAASVAGIVGSAEDEARSLALSGRGAEAKEALRLGGRSLDVFKQQYSDQFHAETYDLRLRSAYNPRDVNNPAAIFAAINAGKQELEGVNPADKIDKAAAQGFVDKIIQALQNLVAGDN